MSTSPKIHDTADVQSKEIGQGTTIWQSVIVLAGAKIGCDVNICAHCFIENDVVVGDKVTIKSGVYLWDWVRIADNAFVGPNVTFSNDKFPRSKIFPGQFLKTVIEIGASIGAGAVLLPGITVGRGAMVGAGAVVTSSVPPYAIVTGNPAQITGYVDNNTQSGMVAKTLAPPVVIPGESPVPPAPIGVTGVTLHRMKLVQDLRGDLSAGEFPNEIPFEPKRYFIVFNVPSKRTRGEHAHHKCHQFLVCIKGSCAVVADDGQRRCEVILDSPDLGIYLPPLVWGIQYKYSPDAILLVFASDHYDPDDYIRNYDEFISIIRNKTSGV